MTDVDFAGAASLSVAGDELIGPYGGAVTPMPVPWRADASFAVDEPTHWPLLLVRLLHDLADESRAVTVTVDGAEQPVATFAPWSERGSQLPVFAPPVDGAGTAPAFTGTVAVVRTGPDGVAAPLAAAEVGTTVQLDLVQGLLGRLLAVLLSEKPRLRRQARELRAMRELRYARDAALDRIGADLGAPRLSDALSWDATTKQLAATPLPGNHEGDPSYRARLRILRATKLPTPSWIEAAVNGPGDVSDPGTGWLADRGFTGRLRVDETPNPLLVAFRLLAPARSGARAELLDAIRRTHLVWPAGDAAGDAAHAARMLPPAVVLRTAAVRAALATLQLPFGQPVAPAVALGMQRLTELQGRLGAHPFQRLLAGQQDGGGSRYELGHGAQLAAPAAADLSAAVDAARALGDPAVAPVGVADDPIGGWLLRACGLRTAQPLADGSVFASALPSGGLVVDVTPDPEGELPLTLTARLESPGDATHDEPLGGVVAALAADGLTPVAEPAPLLAGILASDLSSTVGPVLSVLDLPHIVNVADVQTRLAAVPARDYVVVDLGATLTGEIVADPSQLAALLGQAARGGASSGLPVLTGTGTLALVLGVVDLPLAGNNLAGQHTVAYRWQVRGLVEHPVTLRPHRGATVTVSAAGEGISVVACTAYVRTGGNDPYQWTPTLPDGAVLALDQYEHVMNVVELVTPLGIRADTWAIRRRHVDVDGSGRPTPLSPSAARTYHRYRPMHA